MEFQRRRLFELVAAVGLTAACTRSANSSSGRPKVTPSTVRPTTPADIADAARFSAGLEILALETYASASNQADSGQTASLSAAQRQFVSTVADHHRQHRDAWNNLLAGMGQPAVTEPDADLAPAVQRYASATVLAGIGRLAVSLERLLAANYLSTVFNLDDRAAGQLASSIQVVEMQHAAIALYLQAEFPVPDPFSSDTFSFQ